MADPTSVLGDLGNPGTALAGLGLGYTALRGTQPLPGQSAMSNEATTLGQQGSTLMQAGMGGPLPPGGQALLNQSANAQVAAVRSNYAKMGLSGSTMESQALGTVAQQTAAQGFQMAQSMLKDGMAMTGLSADMLKQIMAVNSTEDEALGKAIGSFAAAFAQTGGTQ